MSDTHPKPVHEPNLEMLSAFADGVLSPDAQRSMEQHLHSCDVCSEALDSEHGLITSLDTLAAIEPPSDFVNAVMARVAQRPSHRPAAPLPWRAVARASVAAGVAATAVFALGIFWLVSSGVLQGANPAGLLAIVIGGAADVVAYGVGSLRDVSGPAIALFDTAGTLAWQMASLALESSWLVQGTLLLLTISLNYAFTRLVVTYQRRR